MDANEIFAGALDIVAERDVEHAIVGIIHKDDAAFSDDLAKLVEKYGIERVIGGLVTGAGEAADHARDIEQSDDEKALRSAEGHLRQALEALPMSVDRCPVCKLPCHASEGTDNGTHPHCLPVDSNTIAEAVFYESPEGMLDCGWYVTRDNGPPDGPHATRELAEARAKEIL